MIEYVQTKPSYNPFAFAVSAAILTGHLQYPTQDKLYEVSGEKSTYSDYVENLSRPLSIDNLTQQMAAIYSSFMQLQKRLGSEFEAAIFSDLESLYEA